ncbi:MAG: hypothetical protein GVY26_05950 [Bacteroidetes bacterium]|jgi:predicted nucleotidyltransferase|nr:hypothetical protein [Bacteroidota bacterium]HKK78653.1 nucleotidyltransferase family protein [Phaeodactylibacter sp.]
MLTKETKYHIINTLMPYHPERIGIFGSYARGEQRSDSDLDILITFKDKVSLLRLVQLQQSLSDQLGVAVDLVTEGSIKNKRLKKYIYKDLINIFHAEE